MPMSTSSPDRVALSEMVRDAWGQPLATALTGRLPPMDLSDIATKQDVEHSPILLRGEMAELRAEFRASSRHTIITIVAAAVSIWLTFYLPQVL